MLFARINSRLQVEQTINTNLEDDDFCGLIPFASDGRA